MRKYSLSPLFLPISPLQQLSVLSTVVTTYCDKTENCPAQKQIRIKFVHAVPKDHFYLVEYLK